MMTLDWPWHFYNKVKFVYLCNCMGNAQNLNISETAEVCYVKIGILYVHDVLWVPEVKVILWLLSKINQSAAKSNTLFSKVTGLIEARFDMEAFCARRTKVFSNGCGLMTKIACMPSYWNNLKIFSGTK